MKYVYLCEDTMEGIFTGIYDAWADKVGHENVELRTQESENLEFFCEYKTVPPDSEKSIKVQRSIYRKLGEGLYEDLCLCVYASFPDKANAIYHTLVDFLDPSGQLYGKRLPSGIHPRGTGSNFLENLGNPYIKRLQEIRRKVWLEQERFIQFIRFRELENHILFAKISTNHNVLPLIVPHFSERFPLERFLIYDENRHCAIAHEPQKGCLYLDNLEIQPEYLEHYSEVDGNYEELWHSFCQKIAIESRINKKLQQHFVPLKFRHNMVEFQSID